MSNSFSISRRGAREKVKASLKSEAALPEGSPQHQVKAVVAYLCTQIDELPKDFNAVALVANGELHDGRSVLHTAVVQGEKLDI